MIGGSLGYYVVSCRFKLENEKLKECDARQHFLESTNSYGTALSLHRLSC